MRTVTFVSLLILSGVCSFAQGTVNFNNNIPGVVVTHVYIGVGDYTAGNGPNDTPPGPEDYSEFSLVQGTGYSAQLFAAPGANVTPQSLRPASPITHFQTGAGAGFVEPLIATLEGVPADALVATLQLRVWDNRFGLHPTWGDAVNGQGLFSVSSPFVMWNIGGQTNPPPNLALQSFNIPILKDSDPHPTVLSVVPPGGATGVSRTPSLVFTFSKAMVTNLTKPRLQDLTLPTFPPSPLLAIRSSWSAANTVLICTPVQPFLANRKIYWEMDGRSADGYPLPNPPPPAGTFTTGNAPEFLHPVVSGAGFSFDVLSSTGQVLTVQYRGSLASGSWQPLLTTNSPGDILRITDPRPLSNPGMFYRVTSP